MNMGLVGVRVSTSTPLEGFTLTRDDGWFDLMVNGGGAITLQFGRSPFRPQSVIVQVPWNEVIIIDTVVMSTSEDKSLMTAAHTCVSHDYDTMKPVVLASWKHGNLLFHFFYRKTPSFCLKTTSSIFCLFFNINDAVNN